MHDLSRSVRFGSFRLAHGIEPRRFVSVVLGDENHFVKGNLIEEVCPLQVVERHAYHIFELNLGFAVYSRRNVAFARLFPIPFGQFVARFSVAGNIARRFIPRVRGLVAVRPLRRSVGMVEHHVYGFVAPGKLIGRGGSRQLPIRAGNVVGVLFGRFVSFIVDKSGRRRVVFVVLREYRFCVLAEALVVVERAVLFLAVIADALCNGVGKLVALVFVCVRIGAEKQLIIARFEFVSAETVSVNIVPVKTSKVANVKLYVYRLLFARFQKFRFFAVYVGYVGFFDIRIRSVRCADV